MDLGIRYQRCTCGIYLVPPLKLSKNRADFIEEEYRTDYPKYADRGEVLENVVLRGLDLAKKHGYEVKRNDLRPYEYKRGEREPTVPETALIWVLEKILCEYTLDEFGRFGRRSIFQLRVKTLEALIEGSEKEGHIKVKCPKCGRVTFEWRKPT